MANIGQLAVAITANTSGLTQGLGAAQKSTQELGRTVSQTSAQTVQGFAATAGGMSKVEQGAARLRAAGAGLFQIGQIKDMTTGLHAVGNTAAATSAAFGPLGMAIGGAIAVGAGLIALFVKSDQEAQKLAASAGNAFARMSQGANTLAAAVRAVEAEQLKKALEEAAQITARAALEARLRVADPSRGNLMMGGMVGPEQLMREAHAESVQAIARGYEQAAAAAAALRAVLADPALAAAREAFALGEAETSIAHMARELDNAKAAVGLTANEAARLAQAQRFAEASGIDLAEAQRRLAVELRGAARAQQELQTAQAQQGATDLAARIGDETQRMMMAANEAERWALVQEHARKSGLSLAEAARALAPQLEQVQRAQEVRDYARTLTEATSLLEKMRKETESLGLTEAEVMARRASAAGNEGLAAQLRQAQRDRERAEAEREAPRREREFLLELDRAAAAAVARPVAVQALTAGSSGAAAAINRQAEADRAAAESPIERVRRVLEQQRDSDRRREARLTEIAAALRDGVFDVIE